MTHGRWRLDLLAVLLSGCLAAASLVPAAFERRRLPQPRQVGTEHEAACRRARSRCRGSEVHQVSAAVSQDSHAAESTSGAASTDGDQIGEGHAHAAEDFNAYLGLGLLGARVDRLQPGRSGGSNPACRVTCCRLN